MSNERLDDAEEPLVKCERELALVRQVGELLSEIFLANQKVVR